MEHTMTNNNVIERNQPVTHHTFSSEIIYHFNCGECKNWWSYASIESRYSWQSSHMTCPHCGVNAEIRPNDKGLYQPSNP
jgi:hypothetical protein